MIQELKKYYNEYAKYYDRKHISENSALRYIETKRKTSVLTMLTKFGLLLDVACGTGYYLQLLRNENNCLIGGDLSREMITVCNSKNIKSIYIGSYGQIPFKDEVFDVVLCINAFQYADNPQKVLDEMSRILKTNGTLLLTFFNILNFRGFNLIRKFFTNKFSPSIYEKRYSCWQIRKMLNELGLRIIDIEGINFLPYPATGEKRDKKTLEVFSKFETILGRSPMMYFSGEIVIKCARIN